MSDPNPGWLLEDAIDLFHQGYGAVHVEQVTGFAARHVESAARYGSRRPMTLSRTL